MGIELDSLVTVAERRTLNKLQSILDNTHHPLHNTYTRRRSVFSGRLLSQFSIFFFALFTVGTVHFIY